MSDINGAINDYRPLWFYVVYELPQGIHGFLMDWKPAWVAQKDYPLVYKFQGTQATYWIATDDNNIDRSQALAFAVAIHDGKFKRYHVDLEEVSR